MTDVLKEEVYEMIGAAMEVHRTLGIGFLEAVYHEALEIEWRQRRIPFVSQPPLRVYCKGIALQRSCVPDLIVKVGLLINFGAGTRLQWKRFVY